MVWMLVLAIVTLQLAFAFDADNLAMSALVLAGNGLGYAYALRQDLLRRLPISSLMLLGYTFSYFTLPPLGQLLALQPVTHHLIHPVLDEGYALLGLLALIGGHVLYARSAPLLALRNALRKHVYARTGFFREPRLPQLWLMGLLGVVAVILVRPYAEHAGGIGHAVLNGLRSFVYVPYILLLLPAWSARQRVGKSHLVALLPYSAVLLVLAFITNSRAYLLMGFASLLIGYAFLVACGRLRLPRVRPRNVVALALLVLLVIGPVTQLAMAMVVVRGLRAELSPLQLVEQTWHTYRAGGVAEAYAQQMQPAALQQAGVGEVYFDNPFLNRLANLRFVDNAVVNARQLAGPQRDYFRSIEYGKVLALMPQPLIDGLGLPVDKAGVTKGSSGDFLLYAATGNSYVVSGFRTGSLLVNLRLTFGVLWPLLLMVLSAVVFAFVDAWCWVVTDRQTGTWSVRFNPLVIGMLFSLVFMFTSAATGTESLAGLLSIPVRGWLQIAVLYAIAFWASRLLSGRRRS
ncbi:MAG: hypothetical protein M0P72_10060 [Metallibacterium scheffleri]|uniref:hypothetical protein n=1 Tax=Metallibacterium scheffleri TaxID=993689 RepID=UPI0026EFF586|nr:hypothetical protein [Metallibacterium scheffleri]MCK9367476.1 hypothetical protein [Metallibacterium scheffleri]